MNISIRIPRSPALRPLNRPPRLLSPVLPTKHPRNLKLNAEPCDPSSDPASALVHVATSIKATGVPRLEELMALSAPDAITRAVVLITRILILGSLGGLLLGALHARLCAVQRNSREFYPIQSTLASATKPGLVLLPYYIVARLATVASALVEVLAIKKRPEFDILTRHNSEMVLSIVRTVTQFLQDTSELVFIVFVAWTVNRLKERILDGVRLRVLRESEGAEPTSLSRLLDGGSAVLGWIIWIGAGVVALNAYGVDLRPLLTSLGASSIVLGIAAQSILSNLVSGVALYTSPAFIIGDKVQFLTTGGGKVAEGVVQVIAPTRTIIRDEQGALVYINNSDLAKMVVRNESQAVAVLP